MTEEKEVKKIVRELYKAYGSDTGCLFGIDPRYRDSVKAIVEFALNFDKGEEK